MNVKGNKWNEQKITMNTIHNTKYKWKKRDKHLNTTLNLWNI